MPASENFPRYPKVIQLDARRSHQLTLTIPALLDDEALLDVLGAEFLPVAVSLGARNMPLLTPLYVCWDEIGRNLNI